MSLAPCPVTEPPFGRIRRSFPHLELLPNSVPSENTWTCPILSGPLNQGQLQTLASAAASSRAATATVSPASPAVDTTTTPIFGRSSTSAMRRLTSVGSGGAYTGTWNPSKSSAIETLTSGIATDGCVRIKRVPARAREGISGAATQSTCTAVGLVCVAMPSEPTVVRSNIGGFPRMRRTWCRTTRKSISPTESSTGGLDVGRLRDDLISCLVACCLSLVCW
jgi:hypothetical protein